MHVAPLRHWPKQSSTFLAHVGPPHPSRHVHWNEPGVFWQEIAFMHGPIDDAGDESHSSTSEQKRKMILIDCAMLL